MDDVGNDWLVFMIVRGSCILQALGEGPYTMDLL